MRTAYNSFRLLSAWKQVVPLVPKVVSYTIACVLVLICLVSIPRCLREVLSIFRLDEAGYGDSYILYDVLNFQKTGIIYRDLSQPPYLPAQYSPLVYIVYSLPGRIVSWQNSFVAPRLVAIAAYLACIGMVTSIVWALIPSRLAWMWGMLLPLSTSSMWYWILQIRGDFPGISLSLLAIRVLLSESKWAVPLAGVFAGFAMQFKVTFIAAAVAGTLWLMAQRRWKDVAGFGVLAAISSAGPYLLYSLREPRMIEQMLAISPGVRNITGNLGLMDEAVSELVLLLALLGFAAMEWRRWPKETLIVIYAMTSFAVSGMAAMQAGGAVNYYFELLFAVIPIAVLGVFRLMDLARRSAVLGFVLTSVLVIHFLAPRSMLLYDEIPMVRRGWIVSGNAQFEQLENVLKGHRTFSAVSRLSLFDPDPPLVEPYLLSYLNRLGKVDLAPIIEPLDRSEYDLVITYDSPGSWRGVMSLDPVLRQAIAGSYRPHCAFMGWLFHLPNEVDPSSSSLGQGLRKIGCSPVSGKAATNW